ncbi:MAG: hypothetical protein NT040_02445 [Bacteroidetes bacterium]|nr:hypothetical protein [Bacteroidota bacterium]
METIILSGNSKVNLRLILKLAKQLNVSAKRLSAEDVENIGMAISIDEGLKSGLINDKEKQDFISLLKQG